MENQIDAAKLRLFDILTSGADYSELCECVAEFVRNPVALTLPTRTILAYSKDYSQKLIDEYLNAGKLMTDEESRNMEIQFDKSFKTGKSDVRIWNFVSTKHMNCGCIYNNNYVAVLDCPLINELPDISKKQIFELSSSVFVAAMKIHGLIKRNANHPMQIFLTALLNGDVNLAYQWFFRCNFILAPHTKYQVIWLMERTGERDEHFNLQLNQFCSSRKSMWCIPYDCGFVILLDARENKSIDSLGVAFGDQFGICVSDVYYDLKNTVSNLDLCRMALRYSKRDCNDVHIVCVDEYKALIAYSYAYYHSGLDIFSNNLLNTIHDYDQKYKTSYLETLRVCIHYNQNTDRMAEALKVRKNTVFYRMRQLKELFHIDLKDSRQLVNIYMSLCQQYHSN